MSVHQMDMSGLYDGRYVDSTYGADGLKRAFDRIVGLRAGQSDNIGRVERVRQFCSVHFAKMLAGGAMPKVLDVGSGLCVFLYQLHKLSGWPCTALDPDLRAVAHARELANVDGVCADFMRAGDVGRFDLITFNKVLEHVKDPIAMLTRARDHLLPSGLVYIELPDGEDAQKEGFGREEFFIDHDHVFSLESTRVLAERAGFRCEAVERLREPSSKFTVRAFLSVAAS